MDGLRYPFLINHAIDQASISWFRQLIEQNESKFVINTASVGRKHWTFQDDMAQRIKCDLAPRFNLVDWKTDPFFNDYIGFIVEPGAIHPHRDPFLPYHHHCRINVVISLPEKGGYPIVDDITFPVSVGDAWLNFASLGRHATTPVQGAGQRNVMSLGFQVPRVHVVKNLFPIYKEWRQNMSA